MFKQNGWIGLVAMLTMDDSTDGYLTIQLTDERLTFSFWNTVLGQMDQGYPLQLFVLSLVIFVSKHNHFVL